VREVAETVLHRCLAAFRLQGANKVFRFHKAP
jgi:hypothetical protein